jgi:V8-like Glu-specific endopeptidase
MYEAVGILGATGKAIRLLVATLTVPFSPLAIPVLLAAVCAAVPALAQSTLGELEGEWINKDTGETFRIDKSRTWFHPNWGRAKIREAKDGAADIVIYYESSSNRCYYRLNFLDNGNILSLSPADNTQSSDYCPSGLLSRVGGGDANPPASNQQAANNSVGSEPVNADAPNPKSASVSSNASGSVLVFDGTANKMRMVSPEEAAKITLDYWTPERRAAAIMDRGAEVPGYARPAAPDDAELGPMHIIADPAPPQQQSGNLPMGVNFSSVEGRAFFHDTSDGKDHGCTASALNSGKKRLVLTAAHCVHGGPGKQFHTNWIFEPGFQNGQAGPLGDFPAYQLWAKEGWTKRGDLHYDYGIAIMNNNTGGRRIVDAVGGNGIATYPGRIFVTEIGYADNISNGRIQHFCQATTSRASSANPDQKFRCPMEHGASGAPMLRDYNNNSRLGIAVSNQSYIMDGAPGYVFGPYYDKDTWSLYQDAENASPK